MQFADRITAIRKRLKLSQDKFGELVDVSQRTVAFWESGDRMPSYTVISVLADRLGVTVDYLLGRTDDKTGATKKEPAAISDDELRAGIMNRIQTLSDPALIRVGDFLDGLEAGQAIGSAQAAAPGSDAAPAPE